MDEIVSFITKNMVIDAVGNNTNTNESIPFLVTDFAIKLLAPDMLLANYKTERYGDRRRVLRSWIWKIKNGNWQMIFYQGTPTTSMVEIGGLNLKVSFVDKVKFQSLQDKVFNRII